MKPGWIVLALCGVWLSAYGAGENLVRNGDFAARDVEKPDSPLHWALPAGGAWLCSDSGGPEGKANLGCSVKPVAYEPVKQACQFACVPGSDYELHAAVKTSGRLRPTVRVRDLNTQDVLVALVCPPGETWRRHVARFKADTADIIVELFADQPHTSGQAGLAGSVCFADVRVVPAADGDKESTLPDLGENIAGGRPYTMTRPRYSLCTDPDDKTQLTDGIFTNGYFWTQKTTVGWTGGTEKYLTIDLGEVYPLRGLAFNTAAGVAGVHWPSQIWIFTSDDGASWYLAGDLVTMSARHRPLPAYGQYGTHCLWTDELATRGRFVQLCMKPGESYLFTDEIEVYRGDDKLLTEERSGRAVTDVKEFMLMGLVRQQIRRDLQQVRDGVAAVPATRRADLAARLEQLEQGIPALPPIDMEGYRAVLPLTELHREVFRLQAAVWRLQNKPTLRVWTKHRWDPLEPAEEPQPGIPKPAVAVHMMNNEVRAGVLNLTSAADTELSVTLRLTGLPGGDDPDYVTVHNVLHVGTRHFTAVAAPLPELPRRADGYTLTVPAGMTRQVWLSFQPHDLAPGVHQGRIDIHAENGTRLSVPVSLKVYPLRFPDSVTLHLGGWAYTNTEATYGLTPQNRLAVIEHLQQHYVNAPWATSAALGNGTYDGTGRMVADPDTGNLDQWMALWPQAKRYMVFKAVGASFDGAKMDTDLFRTKVGNWARFWAEHMRRTGHEAGQLGILLVDEPHGKEQYDTITAWARAINAAAPELTLFEDPQPREPEGPLEMFSQVDILCPHLPAFLASPEDGWHHKLFLDQKRQGRELWFYSAAGPVRTFDPFSYYLLQHWRCFKYGATGSAFWAFADSGRTEQRQTISCWNEFPAAGNGPYCPLYLDAASVTAAKYMEAIREGVQDYEVLVMLRERIRQLEQKGTGPQALARAKTLLATACDRVLAGEDGPNYRWDEPKDRSVADTVRIEVLEMLAQLGQVAQ